MGPGLRVSFFVRGSGTRRAEQSKWQRRDIRPDLGQKEVLVIRIGSGTPKVPGASCGEQGLLFALLSDSVHAAGEAHETGGTRGCVGVASRGMLRVYVVIDGDGGIMAFAPKAKSLSTADPARSQTGVERTAGGPSIASHMCPRFRAPHSAIASRPCAMFLQRLNRTVARTQGTREKPPAWE